MQRIVGALQAERFVIANVTGARVRLGPELCALAQAPQYDTAEQCRGLLADLTKTTGETSKLSVFRDEAMIFIDQVPDNHRQRARVIETTIQNAKADVPRLMAINNV